MIVYDLTCAAAHRFEGWFASAADFEDQRQRGLVSCPFCGTDQVEKAPMAPAVARKGSQIESSPRNQTMVSAPLPPEAAQVLAQLAKFQAQLVKNSRWVGKDFAERSREMHYGERDAEAIHGQATLSETQELLEEGIAVMPLLVPIADPDELN